MISAQSFYLCCMSLSRSLWTCWVVLFLLSSCDDREPRYRELPMPETGAARLEITPPGDLVAGGTQKPELVVKALDKEGNPVEGAHLSMFHLAGGRHFRSQKLLETQEGIYKTLLSSTYAGENYLMVIDGVSGARASAKVKVTPGAPATIRIHSLSPAAEPPRNATELHIEVVDRYGNLSPTPQTSMQLDASFGRFTPLLEFKPGYFKTMITAGRQGKTVVTIRDTSSGVAASHPVVFPAIFAGFNMGRTIKGDTIEIPISLAVDNPRKQLGHFDLTVTYNPGVLKYAAVRDPSPADPFNLANVQVIKPGTLRVSETPNPLGGFTVFPWYDVAILRMEALESGATPVNIELWNNSETSLTDKEGNPLPYEPNVGVPESVINITEPRKVQLSIYAVEGFGSREKAMIQAEKARELFLRSLSQNCQVDFVLDSVDFNLVSKEEWARIDKDGDGELAIETATGEFLTKRGTIDIGRHYSDEISALVAGRYQREKVNIYLVPPIAGESWTAARSYRLDLDTLNGIHLTNPPELLNFILLTPKAEADDALAHQLGRFFGLTYGIFERARNGKCREITLRAAGREESIRESSALNLMYTGERKLHPLVPPLYNCQCEMLMRSVNGYLEGLATAAASYPDEENP